MPHQDWNLNPHHAALLGATAGALKGALVGVVIGKLALGLTLGAVTGAVGAAMLAKWVQPHEATPQPAIGISGRA